MSNYQFFPIRGQTIFNFQLIMSAILHPERKWQDYFGFSTDHKVIGIQYLVTGFLFYFVGGFLAEVMRTELATPDPDLLQPEVYNQFMTMHGTIMLFL